MWKQKEVVLKPRGRGFHLITDELEKQLPEISLYKIGLLNLLIKHTSASLSLNENADPTVREDLESHFNIIAPENAGYYLHTLEGPDDMPAHIKTVLIGAHLCIPVTHGRLNLGVWQGIYLCEHRDQACSRHVVATLQGEMF